MCSELLTVYNCMYLYQSVYILTIKGHVLLVCIYLMNVHMYYVTSKSVLILFDLLDWLTI